MAEYSLLACLAGTTGGIAAYVEEYPAISVGGFRSSRFCSWQHAYVANSTGGTTPRRDPLRKIIVSLPSNVDFMIFNHRYKVFPVEMDVKLKH
ncbi:hypothetical protein D0Y65_026113 [Glycine soja]|uniref:Uncharacterized protein n=1 Tax=Glycine soja TaxID=3848 RepID=A0A445IIC4_GLYSO|nr:hypothetical protein D0Y65_026113 [Glycine soja]